MKIKKGCYKLSLDKALGDNSIIPKGQKMTFIEKDKNDGMMFFETYIDGNKKMFWIREKNVEIKK